MEPAVAQRVATVLVEWVPLVLVLGPLTGVAPPQQARRPLALLLVVAVRLPLQAASLEVPVSGDRQGVCAGVGALLPPLSRLLVAQLVDMFTTALKVRLVVCQVRPEPHLSVLPLDDDLLPLLVLWPLLVPLLRVLRPEKEAAAIAAHHVDRGVRLPPLLAVLALLQPVGLLELLRPLLLGLRLLLLLTARRVGLAHPETPVAQAAKYRPRELSKKGVVAHDAVRLLVRLPPLRLRGHLREGRGLASALPPRLLSWLQVWVHLLSLRS